MPPPVMRKKMSFPASKWATGRAKEARQEEYAAWRTGVTDEWLAHFVEDGLIPFCEKYGYRLFGSTSDLVQKIRQWGFAYAYCAHRPSQKLYCNYKYENSKAGDDYVYYHHKISAYDWQEFAEAWNAPEFLDESNAGLAQRVELSTCVWHLIDLDSSPAQRFWAENVYEADSDDEVTGFLNPMDDQQAYRGDRRTY